MKNSNTVNSNPTLVGVSEFRRNHKLYFDLVDKGKNVMVVRNSNKLYAITPITPLVPDDDLSEA